MTGESATDAARALADALATLDLHGAVEARGRLALFVPSGPQPALADGDRRRRALALAAAHGFTHLALDVGEGS